jgi:hypothetical protein
MALADKRRGNDLPLRLLNIGAEVLWNSGRSYLGVSFTITAYSLAIFSDS